MSISKYEFERCLPVKIKIKRCPEAKLPFPLCNAREVTHSHPVLLQLCSFSVRPVRQSSSYLLPCFYPAAALRGLFKFLPSSRMALFQLSSLKWLLYFCHHQTENSTVLPILLTRRSISACERISGREITSITLSSSSLLPPLSVGLS